MKLESFWKPATSFSRSSSSVFAPFDCYFNDSELLLFETSFQVLQAVLPLSFIGYIKSVITENITLTS